MTKDKITIDGSEYAAACVEVFAAAVLHARTVTGYLETCERTLSESGTLNSMKNSREVVPWLEQLIRDNLIVWKRASKVATNALRQAQAEAERAKKSQSDNR